MRVSIDMLYLIFISLPIVTSSSSPKRTRRSIADYGPFSFPSYNPLTAYPYPGAGPIFGASPGPFAGAFPGTFPGAGFYPPSSSVLPIIICPPGTTSIATTATAGTGLANFLSTLFAKKVAAITAPHAVPFPVPSPFPVPVKVPVAVPVDRPVPFPVYKSRSHHDHHHSDRDHHYFDADPHHDQDPPRIEYEHGSDHSDGDYRSSWQGIKSW